MRGAVKWGAVAAAALAVSYGVYFGVNRALDVALVNDARSKGVAWAQYFVTHVPRLSTMMRTRALDEEQAEFADRWREIEPILGFRLYDSEGRPFLEPRDADRSAWRIDSAPADEAALHAIESGHVHVQLEDGDGSRAWPFAVGHVIVPINDRATGTVGVATVDVDESEIAAAFRGVVYWLALGLALLFAAGFGVPMLAFTYRTSQAQAATRKASYLAEFDPTTDLLNHARFSERLRELGADAGWRRSNPAVVSLDIDDFRSINDAVGHDAGDAFLAHVGRCLARFRRDGDLMARLGGDEFVLVLAGRDYNEVVGTVEAVLMAAREPIVFNGRSIQGHLSAGIYWQEDSRLATEERMKKADLALAQAKIDGRGTFRIYDAELERQHGRRKAIERLIRTGLAENRFEVHFQPLVNRKTMKCAGFEALLRLKDDDGTLIPPAEFIPVMGSLRLVDAIGPWVIEEAVAAARLWPDDLFVAVNLSADQFRDGRLVHHVRSTLIEAGVPARRLELEVTESLLMERGAEVQRQLHALRELGVSIAMDDFGTGYSSLAYLWQFHFDKLKIDRSFVAALDRGEEKAGEILDSIITLGHKLEMSVTAEGIETEAQAAALAYLGCDCFQGFHFGRPMPAADIAAHLLNDTLKPPLCGAGLHRAMG